MIVARPTNENETDLLIGHEDKDLCLYDLDGNLIVRQNAPQDGWGHDSLEAIVESITSTDDPLGDGKENPLKYGWEAHLGEKELDNWIGSSEL